MLVLRILTVVAAFGFVPACFSYVSARQQLSVEREKLERQQSETAPRLETTYILLPSPADLSIIESRRADVDDDGGSESGQDFPDSQDLTNLIGDFGVVSVGESVHTEPVTVEDLVSGPGVECASARCDAIIEDHSDDDNTINDGHIYVMLTNVGAHTAADVRIEFSTLFVEPRETQSLASVLTGTEGDRFEEYLGDIEPGGNLLVPLAAVGIVDQDTYPLGIVPFGYARRPIALEWQDSLSDVARQMDVRRPADHTILLPAASPGSAIMRGG